MEINIKFDINSVGTENTSQEEVYYFIGKIKIDNSLNDKEIIKFKSQLFKLKDREQAFNNLIERSTQDLYSKLFPL